MKEVDKRNYGIDALRIVSMFMVVVLHILGPGGILNVATGTTYKVAWLLEIAAYCAVNCYALISGYVSVNRKYKYSNLIVLWLQVFLINLSISVAMIVCGKIELTINNIFIMLFPVMKGNYWYFTAYFCMFFFTPLLDFIIEKFDKKKLGVVLISGFVLFCVCGTVFYSDVFRLTDGYSAFWLMYLYLMGAYIRKYNIFSSYSPLQCFEIYLSCVLFSWLAKEAIEFITWKLFGTVMYNMLFVSYLSPTIVIASISLLVMFSKLKISKLKKVISFFAPLSFGVYIIHLQTFIWNGYWGGRFTSVAELNSFKFFIVVIGLSILIYLLCSLIDFIRLLFFKLFKVKQIVTNIEEKFIKDVFK